MTGNIKQQKRTRRHKRIRARVSGTAEKPRLSVFKSNTKMYAQVIDDLKGVTLASATNKDAVAVGEEIAKKAVGAGVRAVVFDRGGYLYTGKVKAVADSARKAGLKF